MIRESMRTFATERLWPTAGERDRSHEFPRKILEELGALGALGVLVPEAFGGSQMDYLSLAVALEEIAAGDGAISTIVSVQNSVVCGPILGFGTEVQKERYLPGLASGKMLGCFCLTEPHAGSDASGITTMARRDGDSFVLDGVKQFITSGKHANVGVVIAVTDRDAGRRGLSAFLVDFPSQGLQVSRLEDKMGQHGSDTVQLVFDGCRIPADSLLGTAGQGYAIALANLEGGRIGIAAQSVGMARSAYSCALRYARERSSFGKPIIEHQVIQHRLATMATSLEAARQLVWHAASLKDAGAPALREAAMAKLFASEMAERVCSDAIQIHGGYGYLSDFPVERIYRDVRVCQIYEGTSDIQRMIIAKSLIERGE